MKYKQGNQSFYFVLDHRGSHVVFRGVAPVGDTEMEISGLLLGSPELLNPSTPRQA